MVVLTAIIIASAIEPATQWFSRHGVPRVPAVILMYVGLAFVLSIVFYFFVPQLIEDISSLLAQAPEYIRTIQLEATTPGGIGDVVNVGSNGQEALSLGDLVNNLRSVVGGISSSGDILGIISSVFGGVLSFFLIVTISFYLSVQREGISNFLHIILPSRYEDYGVDLWHRSQRKIGRWLQGQLVLMVLVGLMVYIGLMILGVPNALLLGILAGFMEIIPVFGPILGALPAVSTALLTGGLTLGLLTAGLFVIVQQFENNLLHPLVVTKVVGVPPLVVIIAIFVGGSLAGFLGVLISVPMSAVLLEFINDVEKNKHGQPVFAMHYENTSVEASSEVSQENQDQERDND